VNLKTGVPKYRGAQTSLSAAAAALRSWQVDARPHDIKLKILAANGLPAPQATGLSSQNSSVSKRMTLR